MNVCDWLLTYLPDARALFERVIGTFTPDKARPLWERWARYEYQYGDLATAQKLEKRMAEGFPQGSSSCENTLNVSFLILHRPSYQALCRTLQVSGV